MSGKTTINRYIVHRDPNINILNKFNIEDFGKFFILIFGNDNAWNETIAEKCCYETGTGILFYKNIPTHDSLFWRQYPNIKEKTSKKSTIYLTENYKFI